MRHQKFYAVRVVLTDWEDNSTVQRDYVRGETRMSKDAFASWAVGDLLRLVEWLDKPVTVHVEPVTATQVVLSRQFKHPVMSD